MKSGTELSQFLRIFLPTLNKRSLILDNEKFYLLILNQHANMINNRIIPWKQGLHKRNKKSKSFLARLASFGQLSLISDHEIASKSK